MAGRGRCGRGARAPRPSRRGVGGAAMVPTLAVAEEGIWHYDILLRILSRTTSRIPLPFSFAPIVSELNLRSLWLWIQGCSRSPLWIELEVDSSFMIFLRSGWRYFSRQLNLRDGDSL